MSTRAPARTTAPPAAPTGRWRLALAAIVAVGVAVRVFHVVVILGDAPPGLDAAWYALQGVAIREGKGYVAPSSLFTDQLVPTAGFPPAYPAVQAVWQAVIGSDTTQVRLLGTALAVVTIVATASIGRRVIGPRAGLVAAAVVALDPFLVASDGAGMSEALSVPLVTVAVLLACRMLDRGLRPWGAVGLGAVCGVAALTRQDLLVMAPIFFVAVTAVARTPDLRRRALAAGLGLLVAAAVVVPWAVRNQQQVGSFTVATMSGPSALAGANCDRTYYGASVGSWEFSCVVPAQRFDLDESGQSTVLQEAGTSYARANLSRLPAVVVARELRVWGLWTRDDHVRREIEEVRDERWSRVTWAASPFLVVAGFWGLARTCRRDLRRTFPLLLPPLLVMITAAASHGNPRFSAIAHPVLAVGAAALVDAAIVAVRARSAPQRHGTEPLDRARDDGEGVLDVGVGGAPAE